MQMGKVSNASIQFKVWEEKNFFPKDKLQAIKKLCSIKNTTQKLSLSPKRMN